MDNRVKEHLLVLSTKFDTIAEDRKQVLEKIAGYLNLMRVNDPELNLLYVCTHNSRRSHFGQVAAILAADFYAVEKLNSFSAGTEVTSMNQNAINALSEFGCDISILDSSPNPKIEIDFGGTKTAICFSKKFDDASIPQQNVLAIMTCTDAEQNCPFIASAKYRIGTPYQDPKISDGTGNEAKVYAERFAQILTESLYLFSHIGK